MRRVAGVVIALVLALVAPAAAQQEGRTAECANEVLEAIVGSTPNPRIPVFHIGYAMRFYSCAGHAPEAAVPILDAMRDDIDTLYRFRDELPDLNVHLRRTTCVAWWVIYRDEYYWIRYQYGDVVVAGLPTPEARGDECERWVGGGAAGGR